MRRVGGGDQADVIVIKGLRRIGGGDLADVIVIKGLRRIGGGDLADVIVIKGLRRIGGGDQADVIVIKDLRRIGGGDQADVIVIKGLRRIGGGDQADVIVIKGLRRIGGGHQADVFLLKICSCPLIFSCPADHVPDRQPRILQGLVEARSVNVTNTHTHTMCRRAINTPFYTCVSGILSYTLSCTLFGTAVLLVPSPSETWFWDMSVGGSFRRV